MHGIPFAAQPIFQAGQRVHLNVGPTWLDATVVLADPGKPVVVSFAVDGQPVTASVPVMLVRDAFGYGLRAAGDLGSGAEVAFTDAIRTVAAAPRLRAGQWIVPFTNGRTSYMRHGTKVRVVDDSAAVTIGGLPLTQALPAINARQVEL